MNQQTDNQKIDFFEALAEAIEQDTRSNAQEVLDRGYADCYRNEDGLMVKSFPTEEYTISMSIKLKNTLTITRVTMPITIKLLQKNHRRQTVPDL